MTLTLYTHPFSAYCQKVLIALREHATPFEMRLLTPLTTRRRWPNTHACGH